MKRLPILEELVYIGSCIVTLGGVWVTKIILKKAFIEALQTKLMVK